jgi:hypothetical protein
MRIRLSRKGQAAVAGLSAALLLAVPGPVSANGTNNNAGADSAPDKITVEVQTVNGSGCPAGTANVNPFSDNTGFRVNYRRFVARTGSGAEPIDFRKNCQLAVTINIPQGFTYAIARADYRGVARLRRDATGLLRSAYYFQGSPDTLNLDHTIDGPFNDRWHVTHITDVAALVFAPCGRSVNLNINSDLRVRDDGGSSFMAMTSSTGDVDTLFHFHWKRC